MFDIISVGDKMRIDKIKKTGSQYTINLDNGEIIKTFEEVILENGLLYNKHIDSELLNKIHLDTAYYDSYHKVLSLISKRLRSEKEVDNYLKKIKIPTEQKTKIITNLKNSNLINDYNFAKAYTNDKMNLTLDGPYKIAKHLQNHHISEDIINEMINSYKPELIENHITKIILKKTKTNKNYTGYILKQKIISYLIDQGYKTEDINKYLYLIEENKEISEKKLETLYQKYSKKYKDQELVYKFKSKLLTKGYTNEQINDFLNKKTA